jgi:flagellum-specific peptidoglycan hydrolase FlgJ
MDPNELQAVSEALNQLREGSTVSAETLAKLGGTTQNVNKALEGYTRKLLGVTSAVGGMAKQVADGEGSFKSLGGAIGGLTSVVGKLASAIPLVGGAAKALAEGVGEAAKFVLDQLDTMAKNYQTLGDASAGAADGVDGLLRQFNQMGNYSLPAFTKAVKANTQGLAALAGTAGMGAEELSKVSGALTTKDTARQFLKLGISLDAVGDATAQYLSDSARYGFTQGRTTEELTKKTQDYILEVDKIARLTGQTREAQAKEAQKSLVDARFRAKIAEMTANGQRDEAEQLRLYVEGLGGAAGDAARALVTGIPLTKEAAAANLFANDAIRQNTQAIQEGKKATVAIAETQQALADGTDRFGKQIQFAGDQFGGVAIQAYDAKVMIAEQNKLMATGLTREQAIAELQRKQKEASGKTTEELTDAQLATAGASKNLQSLGFSLATYAVPAVNKFATALESVTGGMNKYLGVGGKYSTPAGVDRGAAGGPRSTAAGEPFTGTQKEFVDTMYKTLLDEAKKQGVKNPEVIAKLGAAQSALETGYGKHTAGSQNYFGIKARPGEAGSGVATQEFINGKMVTVNDKFRKYGSMQESAADYVKFLQENKRYKGVLESGTLQEAIAAQVKTGYATDPNYGAKLSNIAERVSGPGGSYSNSMSGVSYNSAGAATQAQGQKTQAEQSSKTEIMGLAQVLDQIERNTRNSAKEQQKTNRQLS